MSLTRRSFIKTGTVSLAALSLDPRAVAAPASGPGQELKNIAAGVAPLTPEDFAARRENARRLLAEQGLDALFVGGGTNLLYFTKVGWWLSERVFGVLLSRKRDPIWVCPSFEVERAKELVPAGQEIRTWDEHESPYALIGGVMKDLGASTGKLGTAPDLRAFEIHGLRRTLTGIEIVDGASVTEGCRGVKTAKEIAYMDLANKITKLAYREGFKTLREGMTTRDLAMAIAGATQKLGSQGGGGPQFGPNTAFPHGSQVPAISSPATPSSSTAAAPSRATAPTSPGRSSSASPRTSRRRSGTSSGKPNKAALAAAKPGATCESVDRAARKVVEDAGFGPGYKYFAHRLGHGIGMEGHEYPYLVKGNTLKIVPGMTFSNEPGIYIYGEFGIRTEDCLVVTESGSRHLGGLEAEAIDRPIGAE